MFDFATALNQFNGKSFKFNDLQDILRQIRRQHLGEISPEMGIRELLIIAKQHNWIYEDDAGDFHIKINRAA